jgi:hypothetical protein
VSFQLVELMAFLYLPPQIQGAENTVPDLTLHRVGQYLVLVLVGALEITVLEH